MSKVYAISIGTAVYEVRAIDAAEACKKAIRAWQHGREVDTLPGENLTLTLTARDVPAIRVVE